MNVFPTVFNSGMQFSQVSPRKVMEVQRFSNTPVRSQLLDSLWILLYPFWGVATFSGVCGNVLLLWEEERHCLFLRRVTFKIVEVR
jgi:hypothetical protein